ncbi:MAG: type II toxin-antitoxin system RelE/ParE family toxin [Bradyrhizobium sp.]|uniref:type II toxin-antitoxin system RelE/ParE family toxin n=1 Tax=Bradyrhizobium sp. TaxID=376 RepID=UPI001DD23A7C|nr:type II toxin-antitoxin system RelE/ParE family toxin [Bradyrhizobium sp.]MBV9562371.1 type II toxin-antitoxin system RelE/ParE family toxin [Bradyrhizobium sp.]
MIPPAALSSPAVTAFRKVRFGFGARGKSGGARIIHLFHGEDMPVFLLAVFAKNEKANLSAAERNVLGKMVDAMIRDHRR